MNGLFIVGCGYTGKVLGRLAVESGVPVWGSTRKVENFPEMENRGIQPVLFEGESALSFPSDIVDTVVHSVGPAWTTGHDCTPQILRGLENRSLRRLVYISSTSAFGDHEGARVTEESPSLPTGPAGERRVRIEAFLREWGARHSVEVVIARVAGIYGPGRSLLHRIQNGRYRRISGVNTYSNRIYVTDLARALWAMCTQSVVDPMYIVSDGSPMRSTDAGRLALQWLGNPDVPELSWEQATESLNPSHLAMIRESKMLDSSRVQALLGSPWEVPDFETGLARIAREEFGWDGPSKADGAAESSSP